MVAAGMKGITKTRRAADGAVRQSQPDSINNADDVSGRDFARHQQTYVDERRGL